MDQSPPPPEVDLAPIRTAVFPQLIQYPTIADALRRGGSSLAVDAVLIVGEHGIYPKSDLGLIMYPRHAFFCEVCDVFRADGKTVPVFNASTRAICR